MNISKKDARMWFEFFASLPEDEELMPRQQEIVYAPFAQIERAVNARRERLMEQIKGLDLDVSKLQEQVSNLYDRIQDLDLNINLTEEQKGFLSNLFNKIVDFFTNLFNS